MAAGGNYVAQHLASQQIGNNLLSTRYVCYTRLLPSKAAAITARVHMQHITTTMTRNKTYIIH